MNEKTVVEATLGYHTRNCLVFLPNSGFFINAQTK
jgi:hypothetical protein